MTEGQSAPRAGDDPAPLEHRDARRGGDQLTDLEFEVLEFAALRWRYAGAKETAILERFGWSSTRYHQVLNALLDHPAALEHSPQLVARLRRRRDARRASRTADSTRQHN